MSQYLSYTIPWLLHFALLLFSIGNVQLSAERVVNSTLALPIELPAGDYEWEQAWTGLNVPIAIANIPGETNMVFIGERSGRVRMITDIAQGTVQSAPVLDISSNRSLTTNFENGFLGLAIHPRFLTDRRIFVFYSHNQGGLHQRVSSFVVSSGAPYIADPASEIVLIDQRDDAGNHNGGDIQFGPDGYLYIAVGDEGGANDNHGNSQLVDKDFFAGILRIDVDKVHGNVEPTFHADVPGSDVSNSNYMIPEDNPLVAQWQAAGSDHNSNLRLEFSAIGLRNPWRMAFDPVTGRLWVGDVGQGAREEIDIVEVGGNYGWAFREGQISGPKTQTPPVGFEVVSDPIYDYRRSGDVITGNSITGGVVYRGASLPELEGAYVFGDYGSGQIAALFEDPQGGAVEVILLPSFNNPIEFGTDPANGDVLVSNGNNIYRLVRGDGGTPPSFPATLSATGAFSDLPTLTPHSGILPYEPNVTFWSDYATKSRWVAVADGLVGYSQDDPWTLPTGSVLIKHFDFEMERGNPASSIRLETRFIVKTSNSFYGIAYKWNAEGTEATLVGEEGENIDFSVLVEGETQTQTWRIPSRNECLQCHTAAAGFALSFNTRQLNKHQNAGGMHQNYIEYLSNNGYLDTTINDASVLPEFVDIDDKTQPILNRVRSYLGVNCVSCHLPGSAGASSWDARPQISLAETRLIGGIAQDDGGDSSRRLILPGSPDGSVLLSRISAIHGFTRMPSIGSNELDLGAIELLTTWITLMSENFTAWQVVAFGSPDIEIADAFADPDGDGSHNLLEYLNGTDPRDSESFWNVLVEKMGDETRIQFNGIAGITYSVESSNDLDTWTEWDVDGNPLTADESTGEVILMGAAASAGAFYRVRVAE